MIMEMTGPYSDENDLFVELGYVNFLINFLLLIYQIINAVN